MIDDQTKLDIEERAKQMADTEYSRQDKEAWSAAIYREIANVTEHNVPKWNWEGVREPSKLQKKRLISLVMMKVMETTLTNHLYQFNNRYTDRVMEDQLETI